MKSMSKNDIVTEIYTSLADIQAPNSVTPEATFEALVHELVERFRNQKTSGFEKVFDRFEHHLIWSEPEIRQWLIVHFLEVLKNVSTWADIDYEIFEQWLGPESHVAWRWLEKRWRGDRSLADTVKFGIKPKE